MPCNERRANRGVRLPGVIFNQIKSAVEFASHLPRYREIVVILWKYGFADVLRLVALQRFLGIEDATITLHEEGLLSKPLPERMRLALEELARPSSWPDCQLATRSSPTNTTSSFASCRRRCRPFLQIRRNPLSLTNWEDRFPGFSRSSTTSRREARPSRRCMPRSCRTARG